MNQDDNNSRYSGSLATALRFALVFVLVAAAFYLIWMPSFVKEPRTGPLNAIINNLRIIEGAKAQWALENEKKPGDQPTLADLTPYLKNNILPKPVVKETYSFNPVGSGATATAPVRVGPFERGATISYP